MNAPRLVVIGGGISGLAAAHEAHRRWPGAQITVVEAGASVGGKLATAEIAGVQVDVGAEALLARRPEGIGLLRGLGLTDEQLLTPLTTSATVFAGAARHPLPARTLFGVPGDVAAARASGLFGEHTLAGLAAEQDADPLPPLEQDVSVGQLVRSRVGDEVVDRLVEPLLGGVYAGRADALSVRATLPALASRLAQGGSLVRAAAALTAPPPTAPPPTAASAGPVFVSLPGGLGTLPQRLVAAGGFTVRTQSTVRELRRSPDGYLVEVATGQRREQLTADAVVVAAPPAKAARMLSALAPDTAGELARIETASVAITTLAYPGDVRLPAGSGLLVGAREGLSVKGVTVSSHKWPLESGGLTLLRASVGRAGEPEALQRTDEELIALVRRDLVPLLDLSAEPVDALVTRWGGGLPQYAVGHLDRVARIRAGVARHPGLAICGAAFDGVGVPACIGAAAAALDVIAPVLDEALAASVTARGE